MENPLISLTRSWINEFTHHLPDDDTKLVISGMSADLAVAVNTDRIRCLNELRMVAKRFRSRAERENRHDLAIGWSALDHLARFSLQAVRAARIDSERREAKKGKAKQGSQSDQPASE